MTGDPKTPSQSQRAVEDIKALILSGELAAGTDHLESELAERLGMSRTPVREATLVLESHGLLEVRPRKGVRIHSLSPEDMREIYEVLTELESLAAYRTAKANYKREELSVLLDAIVAMEKSIGADDRETWARADTAFHRELIRLGGNKRIEAIVANFNDQVQRARSMTLYMRPKPEKSNEDHRLLYEAIAGGEAEKAQQIHRKHRLEAMEILIGLLEKFGFRRV